MTKNNKAVILLSGGLDSIVSLAVCKKDYDIIKALHFNYGQNAYKKELNAFHKICKHYNIDGKTVNIKWLEELTQNTDVISKDSKKYWIPNRNGLFVNIGACYAEALNCDFVIIGANITEAKTFKDNSSDFVLKANKLFTTSTQNNVQLVAPLIKMSKPEIVETAIKLDVPLELIWSCYHNEKKHCGICPSCMLLKAALQTNNKYDLQKLLFKNKIK